MSSAEPDSTGTFWLGAGDHTSGDGSHVGCLLRTLFQALPSDRLSPRLLNKMDE